MGDFFGTRGSVLAMSAIVAKSHAGGVNQSLGPAIAGLKKELATSTKWVRGRLFASLSLRFLSPLSFPPVSAVDSPMIDRSEVSATSSLSWFLFLVRSMFVATLFSDRVSGSALGISVPLAAAIE